MHLVVALDSEARPIIHALGLKARTPRGVFPVYLHDDVSLVVSGIGKVNAAAATTYLHLVTGEQADEGWLNVGVAGHANQPIGTGAMAARITDAATRCQWHPSPICNERLNAWELITVDRAEHDYNDAAMYDMEGSGYYATAQRFSTAELVQCYKVISDNREAPAHRVTVKSVQRLITDHLEAIRAVIQRINRFAQAYAQRQVEPEVLARFTRQWRFSARQRRRLHQVLKRWLVYAPETAPWSQELASLDNSSDVIAALEQRIRVGARCVLRNNE